MSNSIKLSPKHGVNPTIPVCFWCGGDKNEIALLGKIDRKDSEAPKHLIVDYEPCDKCKEMFGKGILVIGSTEVPIHEGMFPIAGTPENPLFPTGTFIVGSPEWVERTLRALKAEESLIENVLKNKKLVMPENIVLDFIEMNKNLQGEELQSEDN